MSTLPHRPVQAGNTKKQQLKQFVTAAFCMGVVDIQSIRQRILFAFMHRFREGPQWLSGLPAGLDRERSLISPNYATVGSSV